MYPIHGITVRKWTKALPGRSVEEILDRAHALEVRYVPRRERKANGNMPKPRVIQSSDAQTKAAKKRRREEMRRRPWDTKEDDILRRNYPKFGANMVDWPQKLKYRTKEAIEKRAWQLGLR
jgi:spore cortex formation protein SpoVR/YcgB (stage V sporulation)